MSETTTSRCPPDEFHRAPDGSVFFDGCWFSAALVSKYGVEGCIRLHQPMTYVPDHVRCHPQRQPQTNWVTALEREWTGLRREVSALRNEIAAIRREQGECYEDLRRRSG